MASDLRESWQARTQRIGDWVEAHPIPAVGFVSVFGSIVLTGFLQEFSNHIFDSEILPWLGGGLPLARWVLVALLVLIGVLGYMVWERTIRLERARALSSQQSPVATHKQLKDAEGRVILLRGYLTSSFDVLEGLVAYLSQAAWAKGESERIRQILIPIILKRIQLMYAPSIVPYISLYLPSPDEPEYLRTTTYASINVHQDRIERNKWYIGPDRIRQRKESGTAGWVFLRKEPKTHHINETTHKAEEGADYIPTRKVGDVALYRAFVAIPVVSNSGAALGVLCLDSSQRDTFDGDPKHAELVPGANLLATILKI